MFTFAGIRTEIDLGALGRNIELIKNRIKHPTCKLMAVVKADAYGHGMLPVAQQCIRSGADWLCVATSDEALNLRASLGFEDVPILVLGPVMFEETKEVFKECARVLVPGGIMAINFTDIQDFTKKKGKAEYKEWFFTGPLIQNALRRHNIILTDIIEWKKPIAWSNKKHYAFKDTDQHGSYRIVKRTEQIFILRKKGERKEPEVKIALKSRLSKEQRQAWCQNVWDIRPVPGQNQDGHPCVYPAELCNRLIKMFSYEGDTVLDPWLGSGTTVKVARDLNRNGIGYERELQYKPVIMNKMGLMPEAKADVPQITMKGYAEKSLAESADKREPEVTVITNMPEVAMELAYQDYNPELPA